MKTNFKKLASSAAVAAALATGSMSAQAIITGVPGEAFLVPFAVATETGKGDGTYGEFDTVVRIVVPGSIGADTVFAYTAPHTSPTNANGKEMPEAEALAPNSSEIAQNTHPDSHIHWVFMDRHSHHKLDGIFKVTAEDVAVFDWQTVVNANPGLSNEVGYLVFMTASGWDGKDANFSFFADAYFVTDANGDPANDEGYNDYYSSVNIPALPLADGSDDGATVPTMSNNVIVPFSQDVLVSPWVSGIRTGVPGTNFQFSVVDMELAKSDANPFNAKAQTNASLLVVWNDRNAENWKSVGVDVYNANEESCSTSIHLPHEVNTVWIPYGGYGTAGSDTDYDSTHPVFVDPDHGGSISRLCAPETDGLDPASYTQYRLNGGFVKMRLPMPMAKDQTAVEAAASAAFTINFGVDVTNGRGFASETVLGHDRGKFTGR